jgi:iron complex outermembrane recepter protein
LGYRYTKGDTESLPTVVISPRNRGDNVFSAFIQDEISFIDRRLRFTVGSKFEHNDYTGFEFQPSARVLWIPAERHSLWTSISRAVRTPTRVDRDVAVSSAPNPALPLFSRLLGKKDFDSEKTLAYEAGYRIQPTDRLFVDFAAFYNRYDDLQSAELGAIFIEPPGLIIFPFQFDNKIKAQVYGMEVAADWRWLDWWRWRFSYSHLNLNLTKKRGSADITTVESTEGASPQNQVALTSFVNLPGNFELDGIFRYVDNLPSQNVGRYFNLDLRFGWHATKNIELALVGQNVLQGHHAEFAGGTEIQRGVYTKVTWRW